MTIDGGPNQYTDQEGHYTGPERRKHWPPEVIVKPDQHWALDRKINVTTLFTVAGMMLGVITLGADIRSTVAQLGRDADRMNQRVTKLEETDQSIRDLIVAIDRRQAVADERLLGMARDINFIRQMMEETRRRAGESLPPGGSPGSPR